MADHSETRRVLWERVRDQQIAAQQHAASGEVYREKAEAEYRAAEECRRRVRHLTAAAEQLAKLDEDRP